MIEVLKEEINKYLNKVQKKKLKEVSKSPKEVKENTNKKLAEMNKTVQDLKMEIESIRRTQTEGILKMKNLGKPQHQNTRAGRVKDTIEEMDTSVKGSMKLKTLPTQDNGVLFSC